MKLWFVKPNKIDYDLYDSAVIIAETANEAEQIAYQKLSNDSWVKNNYGGLVNQKWSAEEVKTCTSKLILASFRAG